MLIEKKVADLKPHPMNEYLFDDIEGEKWEEFLTSVQREGILHPLMITEDGTIISGHQRWRACLALNVPTVRCYVYQPKGDCPEDDILLALMESNLRQRGFINSPSVKLGRIMKEYERIFGADKRSSGGKPGAGAVSRKDIQEHLGIDKKVANCAKALSVMPEPVQDMVECGVIPPRVAYDVIAKLPPEQQVELVMQLDSMQKYTQEEIRKRAKELTEKYLPQAQKVEELQARLAEYQNGDGELELRQKIQDLQTKERNTYEALQEAKRQLKKAEADHEKRMDAMEKLLDEQGGDSAEIARLTEERDQYMKDADEAQAGADIELVSSLISACMSAFSEVANDPRPLCGDRAGTAYLMVNNMIDRLEQIRDRLVAGDKSLAS